MGLKHRDAIASGQLTGLDQFARVAELRAPETAAVPGHGRLLPLHPGEALAIGAQAAIAGKVRRLVQQQRRLIRCVQRQAHQLVTAFDFTDADPALPGQIEHAIRQLPVPFPAEPLGCCQGRGLLGAGLRQAPVLTPEAAALDPGQDQPVLLHRGGEYAAAVVMHAAAQIAGGRRQLLWFCFGITETPDQGSGAAALLGALFQPDQPQRCIGATDQGRFLETRQTADGMLRG